MSQKPYTGHPDARKTKYNPLAWVNLVLLAIIGGNMLREALSKKEDDEVDPSLAFGAMLVLF